MGISVNTTGHAYPNFKFRLKWDGKYVAGCSKMSALKRTTEVIKASRGPAIRRQPQIVGPHGI